MATRSVGVPEALDFAAFDGDVREVILGEIVAVGKETVAVLEVRSKGSIEAAVTKAAQRVSMDPKSWISYSGSAMVASKGASQAKGKDESYARRLFGSSKTDCASLMSVATFFAASGLDLRSERFHLSAASFKALLMVSKFASGDT